MDYIPASVRNYSVGRKWNGTQYPIKGIIIHSIVGSLDSGIRTFQSSTLTKPRSTHYLIGWTGRTVQMVKDEDTAWGAGRWNPDSTHPIANLTGINIEHDDQGQPNITRPNELYEASSQLVASLCLKYNIPCNRDFIKKHSEVSVEATACCAGLDIDRIVRRAREILSAVPAPTSRMIAKVTRNCNIRSAPYTTAAVLGGLSIGQTFPVEAIVDGTVVSRNGKWAKWEGQNKYVWTTNLSIDQQAPQPAPQQPSPTVDIQKEAGKVLTAALPQIKNIDGNPFPDETTMAHTFVNTWSNYLQLITDKKEAKGLLDRLLSIFSR